MKKGFGTGNLAVGCVPNFIKMYVPDESEDDLEIPIYLNSFLSKSRSVTVRSIYGNIWKMMLRKCDGHVEKLVLVNGWKKIVKEEVLKGGDLLMFEFDGGHCFDFCIYEHNSTCKRLRRPSVQRDDNEVDDDVESLDVGDDDEEGDDVQSLDVDVDDEEDNDVDSLYVDDDDEEDDDGESLDVNYEEDEDVESLDVDDEKRYLDDPKNAYFLAKLNPKRRSQLLIPSRVIKDYALSFPESITLIDPLAPKFGALKKKIGIETNGSVFVRGFGSIIRRNEVKTTDKMICEMKQRGNDLVHTIKIHILRG